MHGHPDAEPTASTHALWSEQGCERPSGHSVAGGSAGSSGGVEPGGWGESGSAVVVVEVDGPAVGVDDGVVVVAAQQDQVRQAGGSAVDPVLDVVQCRLARGFHRGVV